SPMRCRLWREVAIRREGTPLGCEAPELRARVKSAKGVAERYQLATECDSFSAPHMRWVCAPATRLGTHLSVVVRCDESELAGWGNAEWFARPLVESDLSMIPLDSIDNCHGMRTVISAPSDQRKLRRELRDECLRPAWVWMAAQLEAER